MSDIKWAGEGGQDVSERSFSTTGDGAGDSGEGPVRFTGDNDGFGNRTFGPSNPQGRFSGGDVQFVKD